MYNPLLARLKRAALVSFALLVLATSTPAAEFCATNSDQLQTALYVASDNEEDDTIRVEVGTYDVPLNSHFWYDGHYVGNDNFDLTISGGWKKSLGGTPCGQLVSENPISTVLVGEEKEPVMTLDIRENTSLTVRRLTFTHGRTEAQGGGLSIQVFHDAESGHSGKILVEHNIFSNNKAHSGGGLYIGGPEGRAYTAILTPFRTSRMGVVNNIFVTNNATFHSAAHLLQDGFHGGALGVGIYVTNNTVVRNTQFDNNFGGAFAIQGNTPNIYVINNSMWGNDAGDLYVPNLHETYRLQNNNIGRRKGSVPTSESGNISVEPEYDPCASCISGVPTLNSPLVDAGIHPGIFSPFWTLPALDAAGQPRINSGRVDIGAYENHDRFFSDRFEN